MLVRSMLVDRDAEIRRMFDEHRASVDRQMDAKIEAMLDRLPAVIARTINRTFTGNPDEDAGPSFRDLYAVMGAVKKWVITGIVGGLCAAIALGILAMEEPVKNRLGLIAPQAIQAE